MSSKSVLIPPHSSLVRYDNPILVSSTLPHSNSASQNSKLSSTSSLPSKHSFTPTEDILNSILPPREWTADGHLWVQYVSPTPATKSDLLSLQQSLDTLLQQRQARETGICPIREELYAQCMDELIRQTTIHCAERGLLLLRVRDEARLTLAQYQMLYESSVAYGMRKSLGSEQKRSEVTGSIAELEKEKREVERQVKEWAAKVEAMEKREKERREEDGKRHKEEMDALKRHNAQLKKELETVLSVTTAE